MFEISVRRLALSAASIIFLAIPAGAASVGVSFNGSSGGGSSSNMAPADIAGASGFAQSNWNNAASAGNGSSATITNPSGNPSALADNNGTVTSVGVSWSFQGAFSNTGYNNSNNTSTTADAKMMDGYLDCQGTTATISLSGLTAFEAANGASNATVVVYVGSAANNRTGSVGIGSTTYTYTTDSTDLALPGEYVQTSSTSGFPNSNYAVFSNIPGDTATVTITKGSDNSGVYGIQIIAAPEPASLGLLGVGGLTLLYRRSRQ